MERIHVDLRSIPRKLYRFPQSPILFGGSERVSSARVRANQQYPRRGHERRGHGCVGSVIARASLVRRSIPAVVRASGCLAERRFRGAGRELEQAPLDGVKALTEPELGDPFRRRFSASRRTWAATPYTSAY